MTKMRVWIDQDLCTGDGLCTEIEPSIFEMADDGLAYVKEVDWPTIYSQDGQNASEEPIKQMASGTAAVPADKIESVIESAEECPGECIFLEIDS